MSTQSTDEALSPPLVPATRPELRRRREIALTARWLRQLGGKASGPAGEARPAARFTRPTKH